MNNGGIIITIKQWWSVLDCEDIRFTPENRNASHPSLLHGRNGNPSTNSKDVNTPLSPVTNFLLNIWTSAIEKNKNVILTFPNTILKPIPLLGFIYSYMTNKSTLIFTSGNINNKNDPIYHHNRNYYSLYRSMAGNKFFYEDVFMGYNGSNNSLKSKIYWPGATNRYKQENKARLESKLTSEECPKIILNGSDNLTKIQKSINGIYIDDNKIEEGPNDLSNLDVGCIIFENADKYINSEFKAKNFVEWLNENVDKNVMILLHFSNSNLNFIPLLKDATNSLVIPFDRTILKNNKKLYEYSLKYFDKINIRDLEKFNLDEKYNYTHELNIKLFENSLNKGNLDKYWNICNNILHNINIDKIKNKSLFYRGINLLWSLNNLTINPSFLKFKMKVDNIWLYRSVPEFISIYKSSLSSEDPSNYSLMWFIDYLNNFYLELSQCKRYYEENSYDRIGKDYQLLGILNNKEKYFDDDKLLLVGTYFETEVNVLKRQISDLEGIDVVYMGKLTRTKYDFKNCNLILPGLIPLKFFPLLLLPFNQVSILSYEGGNKLRIQNQIALVNDLSIESEKFAMDFFEEVYTFTGENKDDFFIDFNTRYEEYLKSKELSDEFSADNEKNDEDIDQLIFEEEVLEENLSVRDKITSFKEFIQIKTNYDEAYNENIIIDEEENKSNSVNISGYYTSDEIITVRLLNVNSNEIVIKNLPKNRKFLKFSSYDKLKDSLEVKPELFKKGEYVIILDNNKNFLETFIDIFGFDENIDRELAYSWKDRCLEFVNKKLPKSSNAKKAKYLHELYQDNGGTVGFQAVSRWLFGNAIAPQDEYDIKKLGKAVDDVFLKEQYKLINIEAKKIRSLNMAMGHKLKSIIRGIIVEEENIDFQNLSFEERLMYKEIKDSIYIVQ